MGKNKRKSKNKKKLGKLTLSFIPYSDISKLNGVERVKKLLDIVLQNRIVVLQGRLNPTDEATLISSTMALVDKIKNFSGVELTVIQPSDNSNLIDKLKSRLAKVLVGERDVLTIVGPASVIKEIKKDPSKIDLLLND